MFSFLFVFRGKSGSSMERSPSSGGRKTRAPLTRPPSDCACAPTRCIELLRELNPTLSRFQSGCKPGAVFTASNQPMRRTSRPLPERCWLNQIDLLGRRSSRYFNEVRMIEWTHRHATVTAERSLSPLSYIRYLSHFSCDNPQRAAHQNWSGSRDSHPDRLSHSERCF